MRSGISAQDWTARLRAGLNFSSSRFSLKSERPRFRGAFWSLRAQDWTRTSTTFRSHAPQACVSTNFTTWARGGKYRSAVHSMTRSKCSVWAMVRITAAPRSLYHFGSQRSMLALAFNACSVFVEYRCAFAVRFDPVNVEPVVVQWMHQSWHPFLGFEVLLVHDLFALGLSCATRQTYSARKTTTIPTCGYF